MPSKINWCEPETHSTRRVVDSGLCVPRNDVVLQLSKISYHSWDKAYWVSVAVPVQELLIISCHRYCSQQSPSLRTCDKTTSSASTEVLAAALVKIQIFWVITSCLLENSCRRFGGTYCYHRNCFGCLTLNMEELLSSETCVTLYQSTRRNTTEAQKTTPQITFTYLIGMSLWGKLNNVKHNVGPGLHIGLLIWTVSLTDLLFQSIQRTNTVL